jgi:hypothetical protein
VIAPALSNLDCLNKRFGIQDLSSLKGIVLYEEASLSLLIQSLLSAKNVYSDPQKQEAEKLVNALGTALLGGLTEAKLDALKAQKGELESFLLALVQNPFLRSRSAGDLAIAKFLLE